MQRRQSARPAAAVAGLFALAASTCTALAHGIAPVPSTHKLTAVSPGVLRAFPVRPVQLRAARGEWECFQIVVRADNRPIKSLKLRATSLATHLSRFIGRENVRIFREHFTFVSKPSGNRELQPLWWSDALIPLDADSVSTCEANKAIAFWVSIRVPETAGKGEFYGAIDFNIDGEARTLAVSLNVENVPMPASTMRGTVAVYYDVLRDWYKKSGREFSPADWEQQKRRYYDFLLDYRINAYDLPVPWDDAQAVKYLRDPRVTGVRLPPLDSPEMPLALKALEAAGGKKKAFYYRIDEPTPEAYPQVLEATKQLRALDPALKHLVTIHPNHALKDAVDIWCPNIGDATGVGWIDFARLGSERKKGRETWWYTMVEPKFPYPTWLLDDDALAVRSYGWMMARWGISGFVYSMAHGWGPNPLENLQSFADTWGDGTLLYPGELVGQVGPIPSIRLMLLRDAIEDYELLRALPDAERRLLTGAFSGPNDGSLRLSGDLRQDALQQGNGSIWDELQNYRATIFAISLGQTSFQNAITMRSNPFLPPTKEGSVLLTLAPAPVLDGLVARNEWSPASRIARNILFARAKADGVAWPNTSLHLARDSKYLYAAIRARQSPQVLEDNWFALEAAPSDGREKWRFVVTSKGNSVVERYTREGRFRVENVDWKAATKQFTGYTDVEMRIPLSLLESDLWRLNALRRVVHLSGAKVTLRAFDDAGDARVMPLFRVR